MRAKAKAGVGVRYTSEPADVRDLQMNEEGGDGGGGEVAGGSGEGGGGEVVVPSTPGPRASMEALYKARKRVRSYSHSTLYCIVY